MPATIQTRRPRWAKIKAAMPPRTISNPAAIGRSRNSTSAATASAEPLAENINLWPGPATRWIHSHSTRSAAISQNTANGQLPSQAAPTVMGARIIADTARSARLLIAGAAGAGGSETGCDALSRTGSGSGLGDEPAETAFALLVFADRRLERTAIEVRPVGRHEHELAVGRLPEQEIGQALLTARADDEIGIRQIGRVEEPREAVGVDVGRRQRAGGHLLGEPPGRAHDLLPRAV